MVRYLFDIEANGLLEDATKLHCVSSINLDTGELRQSSSRCVQDMLAHLRELAAADEIVGHNIIKYDNQVLDKLYGFKPRGRVTDTLVLSRVIWTNLRDLDAKLLQRGKLPGRLFGSHSLEAWGYRLGEFKDEYNGGWEELSDEMLAYNAQDVRANLKLYNKILEKDLDPRCWEIEHRFATILAAMERHGFAFDERGGYELYGKLAKRRQEIALELKAAFPSRWVFIEEAVPKRTARRWVESPFGGNIRKTKNGQSVGYFEERIANAPYCKVEYREFNPASRQQIADRLMEFGWRPEEYTASGQPKVDESVLATLEHPSAKLLAEMFIVDKRIGQLAEGDQAWLKLVRNGRIHGSVNPNGAVTGRCTHSNPNIAQVPGVGAPYGAECRALFVASPSMVLVGADLSSLELRCLAHFMAKYDKGAYAKILLEGDIHTENQKAVGLPTRHNAKTFIYAFLYGAGDQKIGSIVAPEATAEKQRRIGKGLKEKFLSKTPALAALKKAVTSAAKKGWIRGLDGRPLHIRSAHAALNTLLQSAGALIAKVSTIKAYDELTARGYVFGRDWAIVAHVHDELQCEAREEIADEVGRVLVQSMREAGVYFGFRLPIDGEYRVGRSWAETH